MLGFAFVAVVVVGLVYVVRRNKNPTAIGAFRNRAAGAGATPVIFVDGGGRDDESRHDDGSWGDSDSTDAGAAGDSGSSDGGGGDGGGGGGE